MGYGDSEEKALYRARRGRDSKKSEVFYYYAYPIKKCKADIETPKFIATYPYAMYVTYEDLPADSGNESRQIFAFKDVNIRDKFIELINKLRAKADTDDTANTALEVAAEANDTAVSPAQAPAVAPLVAAPLVAPASATALLYPWIEQFDTSSGYPYYVNTKTKESTWVKPTAAPAATEVAPAPLVAPAAPDVAASKKPLPMNPKQQKLYFRKN